MSTLAKLSQIFRLSYKSIQSMYQTFVHFSWLLSSIVIANWNVVTYTFSNLSPKFLCPVTIIHVFYTCLAFSTQDTKTSSKNPICTLLPYFHFHLYFPSLKCFPFFGYLAYCQYICVAVDTSVRSLPLTLRLFNIVMWVNVGGSRSHESNIWTPNLESEKWEGIPFTLEFSLNFELIQWNVSNQLGALQCKLKKWKKGKKRHAGK